MGRDCLEKAKTAFKDVLKDKDIQELHDKLEFYQQRAERAGLDMHEELKDFVDRDIRDRERALKALELQELTSMQAVVDNFLRIKNFQKLGIKNEFLSALMAKAVGTVLHVTGGRSSTELKQQRARNDVLIKMVNAFHDAKVTEIWNSKGSEVEIYSAIRKTRMGEEVKDPTFKKIGEIVNKFQKEFVEKAREVGLDISELDDRVTQNIHDVERMTRLSSAERQMIKDKGLNKYDYLKDRWAKRAVPRFDIDRMSAQLETNLRDPEKLKGFIDHVFDQIVNKDTSDNAKPNIADRLAKPRIIHWISDEAAIEYNNDFGSGSIQDAIMTELSNGAAKLEFTKDWGQSPLHTLDITMKLAKLDPSLNNRLGKAKDEQKLRWILQNLGGSPHEYGGSLSQFFRNLRVFQSFTKLGKVTIKSLPDIGLLANEASLAGMNPFQAMGRMIKNAITGVGAEHTELFKNLMDTAHMADVGGLFKLDSDARPGTLGRSLLEGANKLNFLTAWDQRAKSTILSILSRQFALAKKMKWDKLGENDQNRFGLYDIGEKDWNLIRKGSTKIVNGEEFITPDSIKMISDADVKTILDQHGERSHKVDIDKFRNETANKMQDYYLDRMSHVILKPGVADKYLLHLQGGLDFRKSPVINEVFKVLTQFKLYSINYARVPLGSVIFGKGALNFKEASFGGKANKTGIAKLIAYVGAWKYISMAVDNISQGLTAPSLDKKDTWIKIIAEGAGIFGTAADFDYNDYAGSIGRFVFGPSMGDVDRLARVGYNVVNDTVNKDNYSKTEKSGIKVLEGVVPKLPYSQYLTHNLLFKEWEDWASPGTRKRAMRDLEEKTGSTSIF